MYVVPWYGTKKISPALEYVYDWLIDNEALYFIVASSEGRPLPNALRASAKSIEETVDVDTTILSHLDDSDSCTALIMWDEANPSRSLFLASTALGMGITSLELTNGLVPIMVEDADLIIPKSNSSISSIKVSSKEETDSHIDELLNLDTRSFDRETLEVMPAVSVKRMATNAGLSVKTKEEAINALTGVTPSNEGVSVSSNEIGAILLVFEDGTELGFSMNKELLKKIMNVVIDHQSNS